LVVTDVGKIEKKITRVWETRLLSQRFLFKAAIAEEWTLDGDSIEHSSSVFKIM
jgi:hypothetical protein